MKKNLCKIFWHRWRWFKSFHDGSEKQTIFRICKTCGKVHYQKWHMGGFIWSMPIEYTEAGARKEITEHDTK